MKLLLSVELFALSLLLSATASAAPWKVEVRKDSMTDETHKSAVVISESGQSLSIYAQSDGRVWINFALQDRSPEQLSPSKPPIYRVDDFKPYDASVAKFIQNTMGDSAYEWEPKWVNFMVWDGKLHNGTRGTIDDIMVGKSLVFRYYVFTGGYKEARFSLDGARDAISKALEISPDVDINSRQSEIEFQRAYDAAGKKCDRFDTNIEKHIACMTKQVRCSSEAHYDIERFQRCFEPM